MDDPKGKGKAREHHKDNVPRYPPIVPPSNFEPYFTSDESSHAGPSRPYFARLKRHHDRVYSHGSRPSSSGTCTSNSTAILTPAASSSQSNFSEDDENVNQVPRLRHMMTQFHVQSSEKTYQELQAEEERLGQLREEQERTNRRLQEELKRAKDRGDKLAIQLSRQRVENEHLGETLLLIYERLGDAAKALNLRGHVPIPREPRS